MAQEVEIKLAIGAQHASHLWRVLARFPHEKPSTRQLFCAYYDTPDCLLKNSGVALRLRRDGSRWIQTVKNAGSAAGGLHRREEHETALAAPRPDFAALAQAGFGTFLADRHTRDALDVVFTTRFRRTSTVFEHDGNSIVEVSLDRGTISANGRQESICEIELELKAGQATALFELAGTLARQLPVRLDNRSKAQRGYALAARSRAAPVGAAKSRLSRQETVEQAFVGIALDCVSHLQANEAGLLAGRDAEYLHQARVALRRLRSACRVFEAAVPEVGLTHELEQLSTLARVLGRARDLDVFVLETLARADGADHPGMDALRRRAQSLRRQACRAARAAVAAPAYTIVLLQFVRKLVEVQSRCEIAAGATGTSTRLADFAVDVFAHRQARLARLGRHIEKLAFPQLHRLRIRVKRLRYASEFFLPLAPRNGDDALQSLGELQGVLGRLNDDAVAWRLLDVLATADCAADYQQAIGYVRGWCARDARVCTDLLKQSWKNFRKHKAWWKWGKPA